MFFHTPLSQLTTRWRIFLEESAAFHPRDERSDFQELRGRKDTRIYRHGQDTLAVSSDDGHVQGIFRRMPGLTPKNGSVFLFPDALLDTVAETIHAKKQRHLTPEHLAALARTQFKPGHKTH